MADRGRVRGGLADDLLHLVDELHKGLVEQVPAVIYIDSNETRPRSLYVSPQSREIFGRAPEEFLDDPDLWTASIHPDDRGRVDAEWAAAVERQDRFECEYRWVRADGTVLWVRDSSALRRDAQGRPLFWQGVMLDVSDRRNAEAALRESEARHRALVENLPAVIYQVAPDDDRRTLYVSPHVEIALGYSRREWLDQPDIWMELLHHDDREPTLAAFDLHNQTGRPWSREYRLIASDGHPVWFRDVAHLVRDEDGRPRFWQGIQLDITELKRVEEDLRRARDELERRVAARTAELEEANALMALEIAERRRAEEELRAAEHRYRALAEQIPAVTYVWEVSRPVGEPPRNYTSPRIEQLLGFAQNEWTHELALSRVHPDDRTDVEAAMLASATTGAPLSIEYRYLHRDGHIVWVTDQAILLSRHPDGTPHLFQGVVMDITARKEAETKARESEQLYRTLVEQIPAITYIETPGAAPDETRLRFLSPQAEQVFGRPVAELMQSPGHLGEMIHPDDRERVFQANRHSEETGEPFDEEFRIIRDDGHIVWLHSRAVLVRDESGAPAFWHGVALDVTAQRELESRYRELAGLVFRDLGIAAE
jgi:PAS domain S-box-containing protein